MAKYEKQVATLHKKFTVKLRQAKTRSAVLKVFHRHIAEHKRLLKGHLKTEAALVKKTKNKIKSK